ncbi:hypothetical protein IX324_003037 [Bacteroides pyogenes]|nr:hypothetical protein [Bacteroides pyogenes]
MRREIIEKVIDLLEQFHTEHFGNVECDTCQSGHEDFFYLIEDIRNLSNDIEHEKD